MTDVTLLPASADYASELNGMVAEFREAGETHVYDGLFAIALADVDAFIELLHRMRSGGYPRADIVPMESYLIASGDRIAGEIYVRQRLSEPLLHVGGHIGYKIRPSLRNRGIARTALSLALARLDVLGVALALLTCKDSNLASARVIEANGGIRIASSSEDMRRYDIPTSASAEPAIDEASWDADAENVRRAKRSFEKVVLE